MSGQLNSFQLGSVDYSDEVQVRRLNQAHITKTDEHEKKLIANSETIDSIQEAISTLESAGYTVNPPQTDPGNLGLTVSAVYVQAELQSMSDKIDEILEVLRNSNILS